MVFPQRNERPGKTVELPERLLPSGKYAIPRFNSIKELFDCTPGPVCEQTEIGVDKIRIETKNQNLILSSFSILTTQDKYKI